MAYRAAARLAAAGGDATVARRYLGLARKVGELRQSRHEAAVTTLLEAELQLDHGWRQAHEEALAELQDMGMAGFLARARRLQPPR